jgi:hypothetical protein
MKKSPERGAAPPAAKMRQRAEIAFKRNCAQFLQVELDLAITFCEVGLATGDSDRAKQDVVNARKALSTVKKMAPGAKLTEREERALVEKIDRLKELMSQVERKVAKSGTKNG